MPDLRRSPFATYRGRYSNGGPHVVRIEQDGSEISLGHEYEWGLDSQGADRLAFALLADAFGEAEAEAFYVDFKADVVADLNPEWTFPVSDVADWLCGYLDK